jgi:hypothetical protein
VAGNPEEPNRVLGFSAGAVPRRDRSAYEEQHVLGFPASWFDDINVEPLRWLVHPIRQYRHWSRRRRASGTGGADEREPDQEAS